LPPRRPVEARLHPRHHAPPEGLPPERPRGQEEGDRPLQHRHEADQIDGEGGLLRRGVTLARLVALARSVSYRGVGMDLESLIRGRLVRPGLRASVKTEAIEQLLDFLIGEGEIPRDARDPILAAILTRERRLSTGLEHGIAIPHGITNAVEEEVAAVGLFPDG